MFAFIKSVFHELKFHVKNSVVQYLLITYLLVFLIPIVSGSMIYVQSVNSAKKQAERLVGQINKETRQNVDALLAECSNVYYSVMTSPTIQKIAFAKKIDETVRFYAPDVKQELLAFIQQKNINGIAFEDVQLYFKNGFCVNSDRGEELRGFHVAEDGRYFSEQREVEALINSNVNGIFVKNNSGFSYVSKIRFPGLETTATMVIHISDDKLYSNYEYMSEDGYIILLYNSNGEVIFTNDTAVTGEKAIINDGKEKVKVNKKQYYCYEEDMKEIKLLCLLPKDIIEKDISKLKILIFLQIMLAVISGGIVIKYFMRKNKKSINDIMLLIGNGQNSGNEIEIIKNSILSAKENVNRLNSRIAFLEFLAVNDVIMNLVYGLEVNEAHIKSSNIDFPYDNYYVAIIDIADRGVFANEGVFSNGQDPLFVAVSNIIAEILEDDGKIYIGIVLNEIIVIINSQLKETDKLVVGFEEINRLIKQHLEILSRIVISERRKAINEISSLYYQAIGSVEHLRLCDETGVVLSSQRHENGDLEYEEYKNAFIGYVSDGDKEHAAGIIEEILLSGVNGNSNISVIKYAVVDILMKTIAEMSKKNSFVTGRMMENNREIFEEILSYRNFSSARGRVFEFVNTICLTAEEIYKSSDGIEERVLKYIEDKYTDVNLSVKTIANDFSITYSYLSNRFKSKFGISITDHIEKLRITKAKQLMSEQPSKSMDDISQECGYASKLTFSRQFKKHTNLTPGRFRELNS